MGALREENRDVTNVQVRAFSNPDGTNSLTASANIPAGTQVGDYLVAIYTCTGTHPNAATTGVPAGFTYRGDTDQAAHSSNLAQWLYTRKAQAGDAGSAVTSGATSSATRQTMAVLALFDADGGDLNYEALSVALSGVIPARALAAAVGVGIAGSAVRNTGVEAWTETAGWAEQFESHTDSGSAGKSSVLASKLATAAAGAALGGGTFTPSAGAAGAAWAMSIAVTPPAVSDAGDFFAVL